MNPSSTLRRELPLVPEEQSLVSQPSDPEVQPTSDGDTADNQGDEDEQSVTTLIDKLQEKAEEGEDISLDTLEDVAGSRLQGPMLLVPGLVAVSPLSGIPTVPSILGVIIALVCLQMIWGSEDVWIPKKLKGASLSAKRVTGAGGFLSKASAFLDSISANRLEWMTKGIGLRVAGIVCLMAALSMPVLEIVPFSATLAGGLVALFGLAITTRDGLLMFGALAFALCLGSLGAYLLL